MCVVPEVTQTTEEAVAEIEIAIASGDVNDVNI